VLIVWKGSASAADAVKKWGPGEYVGVIFGCAVGVALVAAWLLIPYLHRVLVLGDWQIKPWDMLKGPLNFKRGEVPPMPPGHGRLIQDYYRGHKTRAELDAEGRTIEHPANDVETNSNGKETKEALATDISASDHSSGEAHNSHVDPVYPKSLQEVIKGKWYEPRNLFPMIKYFAFRGVNIDVVNEQSKSSILASNLEDKHSRVEHFDNNAEHIYSYLQVLTATVQSFAHGANDVSNAIGPLAAVFLIWERNAVSSKAPVPIWILVYGGAAICIGLWTYGYNLMRNLGNRLTLHSPCRGFSMELGACITVIMATRLAYVSPLFFLSKHLLISPQPPSLNHPMYRRCYRRCRSLLRRLESHQLEDGRLVLRRLGHHSPTYWYHLWLSYGYYH
jgi:solute carrier family 20 (sodium-dependent phosphate transporter)